MSRILLNSKKPKGLYYNGKKYGSIPDNPVLEHQFSASFIKNTIPSYGADQTAGYLRTFSISSEQFKMYSSDDPYTELNYLPSYKFLLFDKTIQEITTLKLVYDGSNLFHIEGTINISGVYETAKLGVATQTCLGLVDANGNYFLSDTSSKITASLSSSSSTANYISSTLSNSYNSLYQSISENITLPYNLNYTYSGTSSMIVRYIICTMDSNTSSPVVAHYIQ